MTELVSVPLDEIRTTLNAICLRYGLTAFEAELVVENYLDAELRGVRSHGVFKFLALPAAIQGRQGKPHIVRDRGFAALVDGERELGILAAQYCVDLAVARAKEYGLGMIALRNASRYGRVAPFGEQIAKAGMFGIITNTGGRFVAPSGSISPVLGVNPLCVALPQADNSDPFVADFTPAEGVWSEVLLAQFEGRDLLPDAFVDAHDQYTTHPSEAVALHPAGGAKGLIMLLMLEALSSTLIGTRTSHLARTEYDLGFLFVAINPNLYRDDTPHVVSEISELIQAVADAPALDNSVPRRMPGQRGAAQRQAALQRGVIDLHLKLWAQVQGLSTR